MCHEDCRASWTWIIQTWVISRSAREISVHPAHRRDKFSVERLTVMSRVLCALRSARRSLGASHASPGQSARNLTKRSLAHTPHSSGRAARQRDLPWAYFATLPSENRVRIASPGQPTREPWLETALFTAMAVNPHSP